MKFSVLLPTRNRLDYLRHAVESVRRQDHADWEIVVSDNCSDEDIAGYVRSLGDGRIVYVRTDAFLPVTDNWNNALAHSKGDYVVMLGDDDGLMPRYFSRLLAAFETFPDPDFVYLSAYYFAYPGVIPEAPDGFLRRDRNRLERSGPYWLDPAEAREIARGYLNFTMPVASNMQFSLISRRKIDELAARGPFFQSPYPDFYATPTLFLTSDRILIWPEPFVLIGITPKSYGYFHFNDRAADGLNFLNNSARLEDPGAADPIRLPGTSYNDSWLLAMEALRTNYGEARGLSPAYGRYRFLQIVHSFKRRYFDRRLGKGALAPLWARMTTSERLLGGGLAAGFSVARWIPRGLASSVLNRLRRSIGQHAMAQDSALSGRFANLIEVYEAFEDEAAPVR